ncbi:MAG: hypothetical protein IKI64_01915 [Clostridia bacterium]|nr:hypothetical protein [Clostridia bacterium]
MQKSETTSFTVRLAGLDIGISCRFAENRLFFTDYLSGEEPLFKVEPKGADLERMRALFDAAAENEGRQSRKYGAAFLENSAIHALIAEELPAHGALLMHGSALALDGEAYLFTAPSGTGKSTHARLWREAFPGRVTMIDDDKPMLGFDEGGVTVYGTPWNGKHRLGSNTAFPLRAIALIERAEENGILRLSAAEAFPRLLGQIYAPRTRAAASGALALVSRLLGCAKVYLLRCRPDTEAARIAHEGMSGGA